MVVVSGIWVKNVATYPPDMVMGDDNKMTARAVLICRPNSHPFQDRTLTLDQPIKVGRSVARARATVTNAIFDCKVLSRHHALLWYDDGKFYLQDTKSSNGTFVNNNRLTADADHHEVSSGDIVQFGVDVIENNRKVTHGCIIATLKLYLPDGKEAKASPSIVENSTHVVPLDELYKLHQVIQEATQREQCLETKLTALQTLVDEARKSAEESWQVYVGEERLLSRVSALETQLQQATKNWVEDKYREEIVKLQDDNAAYQVAAKEALEKLHAERLQALAIATEQERCRISAEQEVLLLREQLEQKQQELEDLAQRLTEEQMKASEEKLRLEKQRWDLQARLDAELAKIEMYYEPRNAIAAGILRDLEKKNIYNDDDLKMKEELLAENDICEAEMNKANGGGDGENHVISLTVEPLTSKEDNEKSEEDEQPEEGTPEKDVEKRVTFNLPEEVNGSDSPDFDSDDIDSKTLKYKYQSVQNELKKKIEILENILESNQFKMEELEKSLSTEKQLNLEKTSENITAKEELMVLQTRLKEGFNENQQLKDKVNCLLKALDEKQQDQPVNNISNSLVSYEQLVNLEEELVLLKERYAQINEEKLKLQNDLSCLKEQYNKMCNVSYDKMYFYMAPLVLIILYLVISAMIS